MGGIFGSPVDTEIPLSQSFKYATQRALKESNALQRRAVGGLNILSFDRAQAESLPTKIEKVGKEFLPGTPEYIRQKEREARQEAKRIEFFNKKGNRT